jgi:hypothetical protein
MIDQVTVDTSLQNKFGALAFKKDIGVGNLLENFEVR